MPDAGVQTWFDQRDRSLRTLGTTRNFVLFAWTGGSTLKFYCWQGSQSIFFREQTHAAISGSCPARLSACKPLEASGCQT